MVIFGAMIFRLWISVLAALVLVAGLWAGSQYGLTAAVLGPLASTFVVLIGTFGWLRLRLRIRLADMVGACLRSTGVTIASLIAPTLLVIWPEAAPDATVLLLLLAGTGWAIGWLAGVFLFKHTLREEILTHGLSWWKPLEK